MNRLAPLIVRRAGPLAPAAAFAAPAPSGSDASGKGDLLATAGRHSEDIRLFLLGYLGGLVFFLTLLG
jgi:hypothetical protein